MTSPLGWITVLILVCAAGPAAPAAVQPSDLVRIVSGATPKTAGDTTREPSASSTDTAAATENKTRYVCRGTNPFWTLKIEQNHLDFDLAGQNVKSYAVPNAPSANSAQSILHFAGTGESSADTLSATVINTRLTTGLACNDGMSEQAYDFSVIVLQSGKVSDGCCWLER